MSPLEVSACTIGSRPSLSVLNGKSDTCENLPHSKIMKKTCLKQDLQRGHAKQNQEEEEILIVEHYSSSAPKTSFNHST